MNSYKNKMKVCFIIAIVCAILNTFVVISDIVDKSGLVSVYIDASCLASTIFSSIVYGIFLSKDIAFAKRYRALLIVTCCFSFIGSIQRHLDEIYKAYLRVFYPSLIEITALIPPYLKVS